MGAASFTGGPRFRVLACSLPGGSRRQRLCQEATPELGLLFGTALDACPRVPGPAGLPLASWRIWEPGVLVAGAGGRCAELTLGAPGSLEPLRVEVTS